MKHTIINLIYNEKIFIKYKLPFYYRYFSQIIFVDYDILSGKVSDDGTLEFIKQFPDPDNKILLLTDFNKIKDTIPYNKNEILGILEEDLMMKYAIKFVNTFTDVLWTIDLDEFFNPVLFDKVEEEFKNDENLFAIDLYWKTFIYNQYNILDEPGRTKGFYPVRIKKYDKNITEKHSTKYDLFTKNIGKTKLLDEYLYHFSYIGHKRCYNKLNMYNRCSTSKHMQSDWLNQYLNHLLRKNKYVNLIHPGSRKILIKYDGPFPEGVDINNMITELNKDIKY
jgi:hypothetical protein